MNLNIVATGSSGNCIGLESEGRHIIIDAGISCSRVKSFFKNKDGFGKDLKLFITHEHYDHVVGLSAFAKAFSPRVYSSEKTADVLLSIGVPEKLLYILEADKEYDLGFFSVKPFMLAHDALEPFGYRFCIEGRNIGFATDCGVISEYIQKALEGVDTLVLESNYEYELLKKSKYPSILKKRIASPLGHLSNQDAMQLVGLLSDKGLKRCFFAHVSENSNDYELLERYAASCKECYNVDTFVLRQKVSQSFYI